VVQWNGLRVPAPAAEVLTGVCAAGNRAATWDGTPGGSFSNIRRGYQPYRSGPHGRRTSSCFTSTSSREGRSSYSTTPAPTQE
jgi:hypothetical protein